MRTASAAAAACAIGLIFATARAEQAPPLILTKPVEMVQGGIAELEVAGADLASVEGRFGKAKIPFYRNAQGNFIALLGVDLEAKPGVAMLHIKRTTRGGMSRENEVPVPIKAKSFPEENFAVAPHFDQLTPEVLERVRKEQQQFARAFSTSVPTRLWKKPFMMPVTMDVSSPFGYRRVINGTPRAPHTGVDLRAPMATEVAAANDGRVALIGDFFFSGKSIVLDHGGGLYTVYFHLSEFKLEEGNDVHKGDVIGLSGMTGRVTGPHLHWGARLNGARVDPFELVEKLGGKLYKPARADAHAD
jgi:murein DD-endopeptidase MepM/ murein hydrolase activator NlpD